jgi:cytochrome c
MLAIMMVILLVQPAASSNLAAPLSKRPLALSQHVKMGHALASRNCQSCHAIGRTGLSPNPVAPQFRYLSRKYPIDSLSEAFAEGVFIGHSVMPQFQFAPDEVTGLIAYLKSVQVRDNTMGKKPRSN